ncbi:MAG: hypothetical protein J6G98_01040 [Bacilli bacterium]|nr:hypothetical protein [Bacilli bacterium]
MDDKDIFEDEIIDLEEDEPVEELTETDVSEESFNSNLNSPRVSPSIPNITKRGNKDNTISNVLNKNRLSNSDKATPQKLQNLNRNNRSFPPLGGSSFSNQDEEDGLKEKVKDKVGGKALTVLSGGLVHGKVAEELSSLARRSGTLEQANPLNKYKWPLIIGCSMFFLIVFVFMLIIISSSDTKDLNMNSSYYVDSVLSEEEIINQLVYYGYCSKKSDCKKTGIYKYISKLKEINDEYSKECPEIKSINNPCEVSINSSLILETLNYYQNAFEAYDSKETGTTEEEAGISGFFSKIYNKWKEQKRINTMLDDAEKLAQAQVEYVEETCKKNETDKTKTTLKYFQVNLDKYASYLAYGETSSHPNYKGEPVKIENEICVGQQDSTNIATPSGE